MRAIRTFGKTPINPIPVNGEPVRLSCFSNSPNNIDAWVEKSIADFIAKPEGGWLILNVHGLDNEGWGLISTTFLTGLLKRLVKVEHLEIMPVGEVLRRTR